MKGIIIMNLRPKEEIITALKSAMPVSTFMSVPWGESILDHRDINRLLAYLTLEEAQDTFDAFEDKTIQDWGDVKPWDIQVIKEHIESSLEFAFEKAFNQRGISSSLMHGVMRMWMWVIQDNDLADGDSGYSDYGLAYLYRIRDKHFPDMRPQE